jgi:hypothetical protein
MPAARKPRPRDQSQLVTLMVDIAAGQVEHKRDSRPEDANEDPAAVFTR